MNFNKARGLYKLLDKSIDALGDAEIHLDSLCWEDDEPEFLMAMRDNVDHAHTLVWQAIQRLLNCLVMPAIPDGNGKEDCDESQ